MSVGTVMVLLLVLVAFDPRIREQVNRRAAAHPSQEAASVERQARNVAAAIASTARDTTRGHTQLLVFTLGAGVLVLFMLRT